MASHDRLQVLPTVSRCLFVVGAAPRTGAHVQPCASPCPSATRNCLGFSAAARPCVRHLPLSWVVLPRGGSTLPPRAERDAGGRGWPSHSTAWFSETLSSIDEQPDAFMPPIFLLKGSGTSSVFEGVPCGPAGWCPTAEAGRSSEAACPDPRALPLAGLPRACGRGPFRPPPAALPHPPLTSARAAILDEAPPQGEPAWPAPSMRPPGPPLPRGP